ncbi:MAG: PAS domain S-box protein [Candidatus Freyarchaeum deiterrae]
MKGVEKKEKPNIELAVAIQNRTAELTRANEALKAEIEELKQAEKKLHEASLYPRSLIEASLDPLVTISVEGKITDVNRATELVTGLSRDQLIGQDFSDYFTEPDKARAGYQQVFTEGFVRDYPLAIRHISGRITEVLYNATVYKNEAGEIQGVFAAARDITERKQAEEKLHAASLYARSLIEASLDPLVTINAEGKITDVNKATEEVTGVPREQLIGSDFSDYFTEPKKAEEGYLKVFTEGLVRDYPLAIRHKSGKITDVLYNATVYRNDAGEIQGVFAAARDITERKQAEERVREQAELLDEAHDAITVRNLENCIIYWNKGAEQMYGWTAEEVIGRKANEFLYKEDAPPSAGALKTVIERGEWSGELHQVTKDGKEIIVDSHWTLMRDSEGNLKSIMAINTDITDKKNLETQMLRAQRMESIGTLAGGIAHDLNNVLTPITLSLQLLQEKLTDNKDKEILEILQNSAQRGSDLVRQVLLFTRGIESERKPIQPRSLITEVEKIMEETFPKSIEIRRRIPSDLSIISGDATQLHQVLMNLCVNARDAMPDGGILEISADNDYIDEEYARLHLEAKVGNYVVISVSDTGTGMPLEVRNRLFEPFFTTKERGKGTGLGLSTALAIVKNHGGFINVYSEVRKGSVFKVYLPAIIETEPMRAEKLQPKRVKGHGELILVVDDESPICNVTCSILESNGYKAISAKDGAEAVAVFVENKNAVKIILMDMAMPIMDGAMGIKAIRKVDPKAKIIAVSGLPANGKLASVSESVNAFLAKPYTTERLLKTIDDILNVE